jgi:LysR family glycine cleavage system transcriptional activator
LLQPFSLLAPAGRGYYLVYPDSRRNAPKIKMFRDWMLEATAFMRKES